MFRKGLRVVKNYRKLKTVVTMYLLIPLSIMLIFIFLLVVTLQDRQILIEIKQQARILTEQILITRQWILDHNGIWVTTKDGAYIRKDGDKYFKLPPIVMSELSRYTEKNNSFKYRIVSTKPANQRNKANQLEASSISRLKTGEPFVEVLTKEQGNRTYHYFTPLLIKENCLNCKSNEGYQPGELRGAIHVLIPYEATHTAITQAKILYSGIILTAFGIMIVLIFTLFRRRVLYPLSELEKAAFQLGQGNLNARIATITSGDEFEQVGMAFNEMSARLQQSYQDLVKLSHDNHSLSLINNELNKQAVTDSLTGLFNHRFFHDTLDNEIKRSETFQLSFTVAIIDIDNFKQVNDTYGHLAGDEVLRKVAQVIRENVRQSDIPARYGGEEFGVLFYHAGKEKALIITERIRQSVEDLLVKTGGVEIGVTVSIGLAEYPREASNKNTLIQEADARLYAAKRAGKNRVMSSDVI